MRDGSVVRNLQQGAEMACVRPTVPLVKIGGAIGVPSRARKLSLALLPLQHHKLLVRPRLEACWSRALRKCNTHAHSPTRQRHDPDSGPPLRRTVVFQVQLDKARSCPQHDLLAAFIQYWPTLSVLPGGFPNQHRTVRYDDRRAYQPLERRPSPLHAACRRDPPSPLHLLHQRACIDRLR